jgi:hypothetical protein
MPPVPSPIPSPIPSPVPRLIAIYRPGQMAVPAGGGCRTCEHFQGRWIAREAHAVCCRGGRLQVQADPRAGCAFHLRAAGAD